MCCMEAGLRGSRLKKVSPDHGWPVRIDFLLSLTSWWIGICAEFELTPMQGHAMRVIDPAKPITMSRLAGNLACDASNITGIVDKLEARGLLARRVAACDRRIKVLVMTEKGREVRDQFWARAMEPPRAVTALPEETRRLLAETLSAIVEERPAEAVAGR